MWHFDSNTVSIASIASNLMLVAILFHVFQQSSIVWIGPSPSHLIPIDVNSTNCIFIRFDAFLTLPTIFNMLTVWKRNSILFLFDVHEVALGEYMWEQQRHKSTVVNNKSVLLRFLLIHLSISVRDQELFFSFYMLCTIQMAHVQLMFSLSSSRVVCSFWNCCFIVMVSRVVLTLLIVLIFEQWCDFDDDE